MEKTKQICPSCGSDDIGVDFSNPVVWAWGLPSKYRCEKCGIVTSFVPEMDVKDIQKYKKRAKPLNGDIIDATSGYIAGMIEVIVTAVGVTLLTFKGFYIPAIVFLLLGMLFFFIRRRNS